ncbi:hypothetical protein [Streptomyces pseudovenezuelae]|uniref:Secreted protein n=1 Tax=Streptomyces pseudovenezuelae TaxID=67350 RepID=A0ABT6LZB2_9ACTN|nr:hypothetical protein [Streptomyces pseudovenezuelae]MDH6221637.1 hypothetical protein [Streptomyces pseudovenezuelae]
MRDKRSLPGLIGALVVVLAALFGAGPAQAADSPSGHYLMLPTAPHSAAARSAVAHSPGISPAANKVVHVAVGDGVACDSGNFCTAVWDPTTNDWKVFFLFQCALYSLSYWNGDGYYANSQTGGAVAIVYGQSGNELVRAPVEPVTYLYNWDPAWSIRNC